MTDTTTKHSEPVQPAGVPAERPVRPVAYVQRMGSYKGVPAYGCLLTIEAEKRMKVNDPLYGQAELDAAVAAERERWEEALRKTWRMVDPLNPAGTPGSYARGQDSGIVAALTTLRENVGPNVRAKPPANGGSA